MDEFTRSELLLGTNAIETLKKSHVAVFGIGGVGGHCVEALVRTGIGEITLFDYDIVTITNINRQIIALHSTLNMPKVEVMKNRLLDINPSLIIHTHQIFYNIDNAKDYPLDKYDYIVDAIDKISSKLLLIEEAIHNNIPIISSMGAGNKLDSQKFEVADINQTSVCPLAKVIRYELKQRNINHLKVVYSKETPLKVSENIIGSVPFVPSAAGLRIAQEVIKDLIQIKLILK